VYTTKIHGGIISEALELSMSKNYRPQLPMDNRITIRAIIKNLETDRNKKLYFWFYGLPNNRMSSVI